MADGGVFGTAVGRFERVRSAFAGLVEAEGDLTAQLAVVHRGEVVVDLWSGTAEAGRGVLSLYSASKGLTHLVAALVVQDGVLDLDAPVVRYWPEFGAAGKGSLLVRELLSHQAGIVGTERGFSPADLADDAAVAERLAAQRPYWRPGHAFGYHALVMGALTAELVRRATGATVHHLFDERLRRPSGLEVFLGLPPEQDHRFLPALPMTATLERRRLLAATTGDPRSLAGIAFNRHAPGAVEVWELPNSARVRARGTASFGGVGTARDLARLYASTVSEVDGVGPLLTPETVAAVSQVQCAGTDLVLGIPKGWGLGFHTFHGVYPVLGARSFGHSGAGGQQSLVDPHRGLSYAFLRQRAAFPADVDAGHEALLRAVCSAADEQDRDGG